MTHHDLLFGFAFVLFVIAAVPYQPTAPYAGRLVAAGLACWVATLIPW